VSDHHEFWNEVDQQLEELKSAASADEVLAILSPKRNPYRHTDGDLNMISGDAFFAGGGGDSTPADSLLLAGWRYIWSEAPYYYALEAPDGSRITYVEGDVYRGDRRAG
jgi:hypothetical protein